MLRHYTRGAAVLQQYAPMTLLEPWPCSRADARARSRGKQGGGRGTAAAVSRCRRVKFGCCWAAAGAVVMRRIVQPGGYGQYWPLVGHCAVGS